jgi:hypothetical protein
MTFLHFLQRLPEGLNDPEKNAAGVQQKTAGRSDVRMPSHLGFREYLFLDPHKPLVPEPTGPSGLALVMAPQTVADVDTVILFYPFTAHVTDVPFHLFEKWFLPVSEFSLLCHLAPQCNDTASARPLQGGSGRGNKYPVFSIQESGAEGENRIQESGVGRKPYSGAGETSG